MSMSISSSISSTISFISFISFTCFLFCLHLLSSFHSFVASLYFGCSHFCFRVIKVNVNFLLCFLSTNTFFNHFFIFVFSCLHLLSSFHSFVASLNFGCSHFSFRVIKVNIDNFFYFLSVFILLINLII